MQLKMSIKDSLLQVWIDSVILEVVLCQQWVIQLYAPINGNIRLLD